MSRPKITAAELHRTDLARLIAVRSHGLVAALWRWGHGSGPYSVEVVQNRDAYVAMYGEQSASERLFVPVDELLREVGIKEQEKGA
jgi:hypothetical protein